MTTSIFSGFYNKSMVERIDVLTSQRLLSSTESEGLQKGEQVLSPSQADRMIENVIGVFGLPIGLGVNLKVNGKEYAVPMAVEEPSIVAAVSSAAKLTLDSGGIDTSSDDPILIGQIVVEDVPDMAAASNALKQKKGRYIELGQQPSSQYGCPGRRCQRFADSSTRWCRGRFSTAGGPFDGRHPRCHGGESSQ